MSCGPLGCSTSEPIAAQRTGPPPPPNTAVVEVSAAAFSPDNKLLLTGHALRAAIGGNGPRPPLLRLWDVADGRPNGTFEGHGTGIAGVAFLPDGRRVVTAGHDGTLKVWDVANRSIIRTLDSKDDIPSCLAVSPDGARALTGGFRGGLRLWDLAGGRRLRSFETVPPGQMLSLAFSQDGKRIMLARGIGAVDAKGGTIYVLDSSDGGILVSVRGDARLSSPTAAFSPDGSLFAAIRTWESDAGVRQYSLAVLDAADGGVVREFERRATPAWAVAFAPAGPPWRILSADADFHITLWDDTTGRPLWSMPIDSPFVGFSPDRSLAVSAQGGDPVDVRTGGISPGTKLKIWDTARGKPFQTLLDPDAGRHGRDAGTKPRPPR